MGYVCEVSDTWRRPVPRGALGGVVRAPHMGGVCEHERSGEAATAREWQCVRQRRVHEHGALASDDALVPTKRASASAGAMWQNGRVSHGARSPVVRATLCAMKRGGERRAQGVDGGAL